MPDIPSESSEQQMIHVKYQDWNTNNKRMLSAAVVTGTLRINFQDI